jgi:hypothetical protein
MKRLMHEKDRPRELAVALDRRWADSFKLFAGFCATVALMSAVLYAGSGRHYERNMQSSPAGAFAQ